MSDWPESKLNRSENVVKAEFDEGHRTGKEKG